MESNNNGGDENEFMKIVTGTFGFVLILAVAVIATFLTGCSGTPIKADKQPVVAQCDAKCYVKCVEDNGDTGVRWVGNYTDPKLWDSLAKTDVLEPLVTKLRQCEVNRKACEQCLDRLEKEKVIIQ